MLMILQLLISVPCAILMSTTGEITLQWVNKARHSKAKTPSFQHKGENDIANLTGVYRRQEPGRI